MNKTAIKNFAISARTKLIAMAIDKTGIIGITRDGVSSASSAGKDFAIFPTHFDTTMPTGKFMLTIFAAVAEIERETILQRQKEGIAIAKQAGKYKGRRAIPRASLQGVLQKYRAGAPTATQAMQEMNISKSTFYRIRKDA